MKKFIYSPDPAGTLVNKFGQRVSICEIIDGKFTWFNGCNPKVHITSAEDEAAAIEVFGLKPYVSPAAPTVPECIKLAESHINKSFSSLILMDGLKRIFAATAEGSLATIPKTVAVATWVETVKGTALAGSTAFPPAPFTTQEVLSE